jgi:hypothetical protein
VFVLGQLGDVPVAVALVVGRDPHHVHSEGGHVAEHGLDGTRADRDGQDPAGPGVGQPQGMLEGGGIGGGEAYA